MPTLTRAHLRSRNLTPAQIQRARRDLLIALAHDAGEGWSCALIGSVVGLARSRVRQICEDVGTGYRDPERYLTGADGGTPSRDPLWLRRLDARKSGPK